MKKKHIFFNFTCSSGLTFFLSNLFAFSFNFVFFSNLFFALCFCRWLNCVVSFTVMWQSNDNSVLFFLNKILTGKNANDKKHYCYSSVPKTPFGKVGSLCFFAFLPGPLETWASLNFALRPIWPAGLHKFLLILLLKNFPFNANFSILCYKSLIHSLKYNLYGFKQEYDKSYLLSYR